MHDGMPVIALVAAVLAFVIALAGVVSGGRSEVEEAPRELIENATKSIETLKQMRSDLRRDLARLDEKLTRAMETGTAEDDPAAMRQRLSPIVVDAADVALRKRLGETAAEVGAGAPNVTPEQKFEEMLGAIKTDLKLDDGKHAAVGSVLGVLRTQLKKAEQDRSLSQPAREGRYKTARETAFRSLERILGPDGYKAFQEWLRATGRDSYTKHFFGLP